MEPDHSYLPVRRSDFEGVFRDQLREALRKFAAQPKPLPDGTTYSICFREDNNPGWHLLLSGDPKLGDNSFPLDARNPQALLEAQVEGVELLADLAGAPPMEDQFSHALPRIRRRGSRVYLLIACPEKTCPGAELRVAPLESEAALARLSLMGASLEPDDGRFQSLLERHIFALLRYRLSLFLEQLSLLELCPHCISEAIRQGRLTPSPPRQLWYDTRLHDWMMFEGTTSDTGMILPLGVPTFFASRDEIEAAVAELSGDELDVDPE